ncbi:MAG: M48 family metalloprotease [Actinomycetota bacterium]
MNLASPTVLTLETDSAWVLILAVSSATLFAVLVIRRLLARPGGVGSGLLLLTPLLLPLVAGVIYQRGILPEISVMRPFGSALFDSSEQLFHLLMVNDGNEVIPYAITGRAGPWILLVGLLVVSFMLARRVLGKVLVDRLVARCSEIDDPDITGWVASLAKACELSFVPDVLLLPAEITGAFAAGMRRGSILISRDLIEALEPEELRAILAHEVAHIGARDVPLVFFAGILRDLVAWNPFAHLALRSLTRDREFEADRRAAALTGDPLSVASGLLKNFELARSRRSLGQRAVLAFWQPGRGISSRVDHLIAVADGRASTTSLGRMPFLLAALMVALIGLQVAEQVASQHSDALAIVWGAPDPNEGELYEVPKRLAKVHQPARGAIVSTRGKRKVDLALPVRSLVKTPELSPAIRLKPADVQDWMTAVGQRIAGVRNASLKWETRQDWIAEPIFSDVVVPNVGIYRFTQER